MYRPIVTELLIHTRKFLQVSGQKFILTVEGSTCHSRERLSDVDIPDHLGASLSSMLNFCSENVVPLSTVG